MLILKLKTIKFVQSLQEEQNYKTFERYEERKSIVRCSIFFKDSCKNNVNSFEIIKINYFTAGGSLSLSLSGVCVCVCV